MRFGRAISIGVGAITGAMLAGVFGGAIFEDNLPFGVGIGAFVGALLGGALGFRRRQL